MKLVERNTEFSYIDMIYVCICSDAFEITPLYVQRRLRSLEKHLDGTPMSVLSQNLLEEKNQEIDHLTQQLDRLRFEIAALKSGDALAEMVRSSVAWLMSVFNWEYRSHLLKILIILTLEPK